MSPPTDGRGAEGDDPILALLERFEAKLDRIEGQVDLQRLHLNKLADMMERNYVAQNDLANFNVLDQLNAAVTIQLLKKVFAGIDDAAIAEATGDELVRMRQRGWMMLLAELDEIREGQRTLREAMRKGREERCLEARDREKAIYQAGGHILDEAKRAAAVRAKTEELRQDRDRTRDDERER